MRPPLAALALATLLVTSGCLGVLGPSRPPADERAVDALDRSRTALEDVTSYRVAVDGRLRADADDERLRIRISGTAPVNVTSRRMNATLTLEEHGGTVPLSSGGTRSTHVDGYTAYSECARMGWGRQNLSRDVPWRTYAPIGQQLALLDRTPVYWRGTETTNGTEAAVVVAHPTVGELRSVPSVRGTDATDFEAANVQNVTVRVWIDRETHLPIRAERRIRVRANGDTATAAVTYRFREFGERVTVRRPAIESGVQWEFGCPSWN